MNLSIYYNIKYRDISFLTCATRSIIASFSRQTTFRAYIRIESRGRIPRDLPHNKVSRVSHSVRGTAVRDACVRLAARRA